MARSSKKLTELLKLLHQLQKQGVTAIQASDLTRVHKERLIKNGFLKEVMKGWDNLVVGRNLESGAI